VRQFGTAVPLYANTFFETRVRQLFDLAHVVGRALSEAGIDYRVVGGLATYLYVEEAAPDAGRLTRDLDVAVRREDLARIEGAVLPYGLRYRHSAGLDMLVQVEEPSARRAVHLIFAGERVKADSPEPTPRIGESKTIKGIHVIPLADLLRMKLTSFRLKDQTHIKDLQEAGLITPEVERDLPPLLRDRLSQVMRAE
jgi:hypothetical protein